MTEIIHNELRLPDNVDAIGADFPTAALMPLHPSSGRVHGVGIDSQRTH
jgi:hypothetical protein